MRQLWVFAQMIFLIGPVDDLPEKYYSPVRHQVISFRYKLSKFLLYSFYFEVFKRRNWKQDCFEQPAIENLKRKKTAKTQTTAFSFIKITDISNSKIEMNNRIIYQKFNYIHFHIKPSYKYPFPVKPNYCHLIFVKFVCFVTWLQGWCHFMGPKQPGTGTIKYTSYSYNNELDEIYVCDTENRIITIQMLIDELYNPRWGWIVTQETL